MAETTESPERTLERLRAGTIRAFQELADGKADTDATGRRLEMILAGVFDKISPEAAKKSPEVGKIFKERPGVRPAGPEYCDVNSGDPKYAKADLFASIFLSGVFSKLGHYIFDRYNRNMFPPESLRKEINLALREFGRTPSVDPEPTRIFRAPDAPQAGKTD